MPYAVRINEKSLDLIATNNGGLKPEIEEGGTYFLLQDNPNMPATILPSDDFFETHKFIDAESSEEFRPVKRLWT